MVEEYVALYWAAAAIALWASGGVSRMQLSNAVDMVCGEAKLTIPQEAVLKKLVEEMTRRK